MKNDGYTGRNFNRPGFQAMLAEAEAGKIGTIIVKDMSRFCRNYLEALNKMAGERGQSLAQMALSWILKDEDVTSVLIGASRPEQIIQNVEIVQNTKFTREELKKIDQISRGNL